MSDRAESARLWNQMRALEAEKPGAEEDQEAFFENKGKQMKQLKTAYERASGLSMTDPRAADEISKRQTLNAILGTQRDEPHTRDDLNGAL